MNKSENIINNSLKLIPINLFMLLLMTLFRVAFLVSFGDKHLIDSFSGYLFNAFWMGLRFDISTLAYINAPLAIAMLFLSADVRRYAGIMKVYYWILFSITEWILFIDYGFYTYFKDHINTTIFDFFRIDAAAVTLAIVKDTRFIPVILIILALQAIIIKFVNKTYSSIVAEHSVKIRENGLKQTAVISFLVIVMLFVTARGSIGPEPLQTVHSDFSPSDFINRLSLNGLKTFAEALEHELKKTLYDINLSDQYGYSDINLAFSDFSGKDCSKIPKEELLKIIINKTAKDTYIEQAPPNVILIIIESFGSNLAHFNSGTFDVLAGLDKHFQEDLYFSNYIPPGWSTTHAIESYFLGIPNRPLVADILGTTNGNKLYKTSPAYVYKTSGYNTEIVYGASLRLRNMDKACSAQGYDKMFGKLEMPAEYQHNAWGVYDADFFDFLYSRLENTDSKKPKFMIALTCGNHPPYGTDPAGYTPPALKIPEQLSPLLISNKDYISKRLFYYRYANYSVNEFLNKVKKSKFAKNTVIAVTGDHNFKDIFRDYEENSYKYTVPLYFYIPENYRKHLFVNKDAVGSSADLLATLYNISLSEKDYVAFGHSMIGRSPEYKPPVTAMNCAGLILAGGQAAKYDSTTNKLELYNVSKNKDFTRNYESGNGKALEKHFRSYMSIIDYLARSSN